MCPGERSGGEEAIIEEILAENFPQLMKDVNLQIENVWNSESYTKQIKINPHLDSL